MDINRHLNHFFLFIGNIIQLATQRLNLSISSLMTLFFLYSRIHTLDLSHILIYSVSITSKWNESIMNGMDCVNSQAKKGRTHLTENNVFLSPVCGRVPSLCRYNKHSWRANKKAPLFPFQIRWYKLSLSDI